MGKCVEKLPHSCGSRAGLQVFQEDDGSYNGHCFSCGAHVPDPYNDKPEGYKPPEVDEKSIESIQAEIDEISTFGEQDLVSRRIRGSNLKAHGVKVGVSEQDGRTPQSVHFPYYKDDVLVRYKNRLLDRKFMWNTSLEKEVDLFGWREAVKMGARRLVIVEGEYDQLALTSIFQLYTSDQYKDTIPAVVSVPNGSASAFKDINRLLPKIRKHFKEISLCFDNDDAGKKATDEVLKILPDATVITLPDKDANSCLLNGSGKAAYQAAKFKAEKPKNTKLIWGESLHDEAKEPAKWGVPWPWETMTSLTRGIRTGETIYLGAAQKMGKSEIVNSLAAWLIAEQGWPVMVAKPEEANKKTYKLVAGKLVGKVFHDPKVEFDSDAYDKAGDMLRGKLLMLNLYQHVGWESLKVDIRAGAAMGCKAVFIDPITNLTNGLSSAEANTKLQEVAQELAAMALDLDIVIFIFCHLRNPESGATHDRGGEVLTSQFAGSRAMGRSCNYMLGLQGNKDRNLSEEERNIRELVVLDDREFGEVGTCRLYWDRKTTLFNEM